MSLYYFDTSALSKRYVQEIGSLWVRDLILSSEEHTILSSELTMVELYSALARRKREGSVPAQDCDIAMQAFTEHCVTRYEIIDLNPIIIEKTRGLLDKYPLRAYDSIHLATALKLEEMLAVNVMSPVIFVSADNRMNQVAKAEGLKVEDPNLHP